MTKICNNCHEDKPATTEHFYAHKPSAGGLRSWCKACVKIKSAEFWKMNPEKRKAKAKRHYEKHKDEILSKYRIYRMSDPAGMADRHRGYMMKTRYGITRAEYDAKFAEQNGKCAICGGVETERGHMAIDHNHETKEVRSLLCTRCNAGLGQFKEDIDLLAKAISYLQKHAEPKIEISFETLSSRKEG